MADINAEIECTDNVQDNKPYCRLNVTAAAESFGSVALRTSA